MLLEQRHNTHALSSFNSSSNNYSYEIENKNEKKSKIPMNNIKGNSVVEQLSNYQIDKMNEILNKYNIISDRNSNKEEKNISKNKKWTYSSDVQSSNKIKKKKNKKNEFSGNNSLSKFNSNSISNNTIINKEKIDNIIEERKCYDYIYNKFPETSRNDNKKFNFLSYKNNTRETRFNNIQKYTEEEKKSKQRKKGNIKSGIFIYQQTNNSRNLIRSIKKPEISFITKHFKSFSMPITTNYVIFSDIRLNVKNNICFYTKKLIKREEFIEIEKKMKKEIYEKLKKEVEEEKIPTFSSINSSSSNNSTTKLKIKAKTKSKNKSKKKTNKNKTLKQKSPKKKKLILPKYNKTIRSISFHSKFSNESSKTRLTQKITNMKHKNKLNKQIKGINKEIRKYSIITKLQERFLNKRGLSFNNKIASSSNLRNMNNYKSPFKNNLLNINKVSEEENEDKDKENGEKDFQRFLEEQRIKRNNQIRNFIRKKGMNSYNFFYPKEPSPLLSVFKNKYSIYPTLNINRRSSLEKEEKKQIKEINKTNYIYSPTYRHIKISMKKIREEKEKRKVISKLHAIEKHYGNEKDCPICRLFKYKREKQEINNNYIKALKYDKLKIFEKNSCLLSPNTQKRIKIMREFEPISRNRLNSARVDLISTNSQKKQNFNALYEYLLL